MRKFGVAVTFPTGTGPSGLAAADFNADGHLDLATANYGYLGQGSTVSILLNNRTGLLLPPLTVAVGPGVYKLAVGQLDADSLPDLVAAGDQQRGFVLHNLGLGAFQVAAYHKAGPNWAGDTWPTVALADMDGDLDVDVVYSSNRTWNGDQGQVIIWHNTGTGVLDSVPTVVTFDDYSTGSGSLAVGGVGEMYVASIAADSASFGFSSLDWPIADYNGYLARLDGLTGTWSWAVPANETPACGCGHIISTQLAIARDPNGNLLLAGRYTDSASFGGYQLVGPQTFSSGQGQGFLARFADTLPLLRTMVPAAGLPGTSVTLTGLRFGAATRVTLNGVPATFTVVSPTQITVTVPAGATTGIVRVTTPAGTAPAPVLFRVEPAGPTGLAAAGEAAFALWPNPARGIVHLTLAAESASSIIDVRDALGRVVLRHPVAAGQSAVQLPLVGLPPGIYTVRIGGAARKLLVQ